MDTEAAERFWRHVDRSGECWIRRSPDGRASNSYGMFFHEGRTLQAHRVAYELGKGPIPDGLIILHSCDNPPCVNPAHLTAGTHQQNAQERDARGKGNRGRVFVASAERRNVPFTERITERDRELLELLKKRTHRSMAQVISVAIEELARKEGLLTELGS